MKRLIVLCSVGLVIASCAKRPEEILAEPVAADPYMQMDCAQLGSIKAKKEAELDQLEKKQMNTAQRDAAAMSIIHVPLASWQGHDVGPELARTKGEVQAVTSAYQAKACTGTVIMPATTTTTNKKVRPAQTNVPTTISNDNSGITVIQ